MGKRNNNDQTRSQLELSKPPDYNMITLEHKLSSPDQIGGFQKNEPFLRSFSNTNLLG